MAFISNKDMQSRSFVMILTSTPVIRQNQFKRRGPLMYLIKKNKKNYYAEKDTGAETEFIRLRYSEDFSIVKPAACLISAFNTASVRGVRV